MAIRKKTRQVFYGKVAIGGGAPVTIQSMTNTSTCDVNATVSQIHALEGAGCEIVRVAVSDTASADVLGEIKKKIHIPLVADIHFSHILALRAIDQGVDALRLNPGNIENKKKVEEVARAAAAHQVPIRVGVNAGSLSKKFGAVTPENMVQSAGEHIAILEALGFYDIVVSLKASDVRTTIEAYRLFAGTFHYPLHLGITEAGTLIASAVKTSMGLGVLLYDGIGDTIRVSITGDPVQEITVGRKILENLGLRETGINIISCPTCGRTRVGLEDLVLDIERLTAGMKKKLTVAIMGCVVNGPGEARHADIGLAGEKGAYTLFKKGTIIGKFSEAEAKERLMKEIAVM